jgi:hypothetical protein
MTQSLGSARLGHVSLAVGEMCAINIEPSVKARMLRELAAWYRALAERAANPVIWESRLLTAEDLDAAASGIEQRRAPTDRRSRCREPRRNLSETTGCRLVDTASSLL